MTSKCSSRLQCVTIRYDTFSDFEYPFTLIEIDDEADHGAEMPNPNISLSGMRQYATQTSEFEEGDVLRAIGAVYTDGCCIALTADWLGSRVYSDGILSRFGRLWGKTRTRYNQSPVIAHSDHYQKVMSKVIPAQQAYVASLSRDNLYSKSGLDWFGEAEEHRTSTSFRGGTAVVNPLPTIRSAMQTVKRGQGAVVRFKVGPHGHAVGFYRSRADRLHFFDSDCGGWHVEDDRNFLVAWSRF